MADLFKKKDAPEMTAAVESNADAEAPVPEKKQKKEKKQKVQYLEHKDMNFLERYETVVEGKQGDVDLNAIMKPAIMVVAAVAVIFVILQVISLTMSAKTKSLENYVNDETNISAYNDAQALKQESEDVNTQKANLESLVAAISSYPDVNRAFFQAISTAATNNGVTVNNYGYSGNNGYLSISCTSQTTSGISNFVRGVVDTGLFADVQYNQFSGAKDGGYTFTVNCYCASDAGIVETTAATEASTEAAA